MLLIVRTLKTHLWLHSIPASLFCHFSFYNSNFLHIHWPGWKKVQDICFVTPPPPSILSDYTLFKIWGFCIANMKIPGLLLKNCASCFVKFWMGQRCYILPLQISKRNFSFLSICLSKIGSSFSLYQFWLFFCGRLLFFNIQKVTAKITLDRI